MIFHQKDTTTASIRAQNNQTSSEMVPARRSSLAAVITSTLLIRIANRVSFVIMGFYLSERFTSATAVALILETFYITELLFSPLVGSLSDRTGRKPFLLLAPLVAALATSCIWFATELFPRPGVHGVNIGPLLFIILLGRLLEGAASGINVPATLGYITDATIGTQKLRARIMTVFEIVTIGGITLAIPVGGKISSAMGTQGFLIVIALYILILFIIAYGMHEKQPNTIQENSSIVASLAIIKQKRVYTFLPAWFSINALVGSWTTLLAIILSYANPAADLRHPHQLLYGGFSKVSASLWVGSFALVLLLGMGLWIPLLSRIRRTTIMLIGLGGLASMIIALSTLNGLAENMQSLTDNTRPLALCLILLGTPGALLLSGFTPVALMQMGAIAQTLPGRRGAVMGLYSVVLAIGQLLGSILGGFCVDLGGFYGLMVFSTLMGLISLVSVLYVRRHGHDCI